MLGSTQIIAEVKTQSPFGFKSEKTWDELFIIANRVGDMISIHTDSRWGGSLSLVEKARKLTNKPLLAKGFHTDDGVVKDALKAGADFVLVVGRVPMMYIDRCFIEPYTLAELGNLPLGTKAVWNTRDLLTGGLKKETFEEAREVWPGWLCQASNIVTIDDIKDGAHAVIIGGHLIEFEKSMEGQVIGVR
jgi:indole-3-glycerol phosphate synthase